MLAPTANDLAQQILKAAAEVAEELKPEYKRLALRKIKAASESGSLQVAKRAGEDIQLMHDLQAVDRITAAATLGSMTSD